MVLEPDEDTTACPLRPTIRVEPRRDGKNNYPGDPISERSADYSIVNTVESDILSVSLRLWSVELRLC